jgi:outer membrane protein insertion porin family
MTRVLAAVAFLVALALPAAAQQEPVQDIFIDSIAVEGNVRVARGTVLAASGLQTGVPVTFRDLQRAIGALYGTGQFQDVRAYQGRANDREVLRLVVSERPMLTAWTIRGAGKVSPRKVRGRVKLLSGRPYDPVVAASSRSAIDSLYKKEGYYQTAVEARELPQEDGSLQVVFEIDEGRRVTISQVVIEGNVHLVDDDVVGAMQIKPEGFFWWRRGKFNDDDFERDIRERIPTFYASKGFIDAQVVSDTLIVNEETGKGSLVLQVSEGERYAVGDFEVVGNRHFSTEQLKAYFPFGRPSGGFLGLGGGDEGPEMFNLEEWEGATQQIRSLYMNNGYIYAQVEPLLARRTDADGQNVVDLRWQIVERNPAIVNKVLVRGNTTTHEDVIRRAITVVPGDVVRQDALIQSYQSISNLGFFEQPLPVPDTEQANAQGDVNVVFNVQERHTGNVNFGASVGQGTGVGGFIGLDEPNLFGQGKRASFQWQFGRNMNNFNISYSDPAIKGSLVSATVSLHSSRLRYTVADLGRIDSRGVSFQLGLPWRKSRFTRLILSYTLQQDRYDSPTLESRFVCDGCVLSMASVSLVRDTRVGLPFPTGGTLHRFTLGQGGGILGGSGDFRRATFEGRWYTPLALIGGTSPLDAPMAIVFGLRSQIGGVWGDAGPHFRQLFAMGGVQFGIPLRGYEEFSITPSGFDPLAEGQAASTVDAFGGAYFAGGAEVGFRMSQSIYLSVFFDAGNVWSSPRSMNPTRLFRGAGIGASLITPLGPIGIDYAYAFDRVDLFGNPDPTWKFHFRLGNIF